MASPRADVAIILERLRRHYAGATYELDASTPEEMLVATTLAAQCTDDRVNEVTRTLFVKYPGPAAFAAADFDELARDLRPTGFYKQKARAVQTICRALVDRFGGQVPRTMPELTSIDGVARKTANVVLNCCFDLPTGIIVDTHVARVSQRMGLSRHKKPDKIERDLMRQVPRDAWTSWGPAMVLVGRYTCTARKPACGECHFLDQCPRVGVATPRPARATPPAVPFPPATAARIAARRPAGDRARKPANPAKSTKSADSANPANTARSASQTNPPIDPWVELLAPEIDQPYFLELCDFVAAERAEHPVYPPPDEVFAAFALTPLDRVKVLILGQDPYHGEGQAHGLCFSVKPHVKKLPPSLDNIYKELEADLGIERPGHGCLARWAEQGVLLLNAVLTVRAHQPNSHKGKGWERFTDAVIRQLGDRADHVVFVLWGRYAQRKASLIDRAKHTILAANHPSPLSARKGFFGSRPFSAINRALEQAGQSPIDWRP